MNNEQCIEYAHKYVNFLIVIVISLIAGSMNHKFFTENLYSRLSTAFAGTY